ncbi:endonuclease domain-containing protein [Catellatospora sichuanensis]|uniref:endonuclease domain-containing protein n=1 Tax=Catellatospora sichuanensis TaxID=1969805 RepID=UPI003CCC8280
MSYCGPACQKVNARAAWVLRTYGITLAQYEQIIAYQGGVCGCCGKPFKQGQTPHIDHEHGGHVRGVVHAYCNTRLIGRLKDAALAQRLADYLTNPPAVGALGGYVVAPGRPPKKRRTRRRRG